MYAVWCCVVVYVNVNVPHEVSSLDWDADLLSGHYYYVALPSGLISVRSRKDETGVPSLVHPAAVV